MGATVSSSAQSTRTHTTTTTTTAEARELRDLSAGAERKDGGQQQQLQNHHDTYPWFFIIQWACEDIPPDAVFQWNLPDIIEEIGGLSADPSTFLYRCPPVDSLRRAGNFSLEDADFFLEWATVLLQLIPSLATTRYKLVPSKVSEKDFWMRYFSAVKRQIQHHVYGLRDAMTAEEERGYVAASMSYPHVCSPPTVAPAGAQQPPSAVCYPGPSVGGEKSTLVTTGRRAGGEGAAGAAAAAAKDTQEGGEGGEAGEEGGGRGRQLAWTTLPTVVGRVGGTTTTGAVAQPSALWPVSGTTHQTLGAAASEGGSMPTVAPTVVGARGVVGSSSVIMTAVPAAAAAAAAMSSEADTSGTHATMFSAAPNAAPAETKATESQTIVTPPLTASATTTPPAYYSTHMTASMTETKFSCYYDSNMASSSHYGQWSSAPQCPSQQIVKHPTPPLPQQQHGHSHTLLQETPQPAQHQDQQQHHHHHATQQTQHQHQHQHQKQQQQQQEKHEQQDQADQQPFHTQLLTQSEQSLQPVILETPSSQVGGVGHGYPPSHHHEQQQLQLQHESQHLHKHHQLHHQQGKHKQHQQQQLNEQLLTQQQQQQNHQQQPHHQQQPYHQQHLDHQQQPLDQQQLNQQQRQQRQQQQHVGYQQQPEHQQQLDHQPQPEHQQQPLHQPQLNQQQQYVEYQQQVDHHQQQLDRQQQQPHHQQHLDSQQQIMSSRCISTT